jgi:hypothetical protein
MEASMTDFTKRDVVVDGVRVQVLEAGRGEPLVYFHGAGTMTGFDDLLSLSKKQAADRTNSSGLRRVG